MINLLESIIIITIVVIILIVILKFNGISIEYMPKKNKKFKIELKR